MFNHIMDIGLGEYLDAMNDIIHRFTQFKIVSSTSVILRMLIGCEFFAETA